MDIFTLFKNSHKVKLLLLSFLLLQAAQVMAQTNGTAYWDGYQDTNWFNKNNWKGYKMPDANTAVVIGGSDFVYTNQPIIAGNASVTVYSLRIAGSGTTGNTKAGKLTVRIPVPYTFTVRNEVIIEGQGTLTNTGTDIKITGNWYNDNNGYWEGTFSTSSNSYYPTLEFAGVNKTLGGTSANTFRYAIISGSISLGSALTINATGTTSKLHVTGTLDPGTNLVSFNATPNEGFVVDAGATLQVKALNYSDNYNLKPTRMEPTSTIDYAAADRDQNIDNTIVYPGLRISGSSTSTKSLIGRTKVSAASTQSRLTVDAGTLDMKTFFLDRDSESYVNGGTLSLASGATIKLGLTSSSSSELSQFSTGFQYVNLGSASTVEYYGAAQTVSNRLYGNLTLSGSGTKTMPASAMTIAGNLTSSGTVAYKAIADITVSGNVNIGTGTTFGGGIERSVTVSGNWTDNGTFNGEAGTVVLNGSARRIIRTSGAATFNNLRITGGAITTAINVALSGNLATSGNGAFTQSSGTFTMKGAGTTISGAGITLNNFIASGNTTTTASFTVNGDITVEAARSFTASGGTIQLAGTGKSITAPGTLTFHALRFAGSSTVSTASSFNVNSEFSGTGKLTATGGTVTFGGASTYAGNHDLFNVTVADGKSLVMAANANMSIAGALAATGTMDVIANVPNTVTYNGTATQTVLGRLYNNIVFANGGAKTSNGALTVNGNLTISTGSNFNAALHTHTINGNWENSGTFTKGTSTISFAGNTDATIKGATIFNNLTITKGAAHNVTLLSNAEAANLNFTTAASLRTGANKITVTTGRSGPGWIVGTIERKHPFTSGTAYAFAGPYNTINLTNATGITSVTITNILGVVNSFPNSGAINRRYDVSIAPAGTYGGTMQLQYDDAFLNGNTEGGLQLYRADTGAGPWLARGVSNRDANQNWVSKTDLGDVTGSWTLSEAAGLYRWAGTLSHAWGTGGNWLIVSSDKTTTTATQAPGALDVVEFNGLASRVPADLMDARTVKAIQFKDNAPHKILIYSGASLAVSGNVTASGAGSITEAHTLDIRGALAIGGSLVLNDGSTGNNIDLAITTGTVSVAGDLTHAGSSKINLGSGNLMLSGDYNITAPTESFTAGTGTFTYEGGNTQKIGEVLYNNLTINKTGGIAELRAAQTGYVGGALTIQKGTLSVPGGNYILHGDIIQNAGTLNVGTSRIEVKKGWTKTGNATFEAGTSTVVFNGDGAQLIPMATFNNIIVSKAAGSIAAAGNVTVNADLTIQSGTVDLKNFTTNRSAVGGRFSMGSAATLLLTGSNFPANYNNYTLDKTSIVNYHGTVVQNVAPVTYGHLLLQNGGTMAKKLQGTTRVNGNLTLASGATLNGEGQTLRLSGNFANNGAFQPATDYTTGTLELTSDNIAANPPQEITGNTLTVNGLVIEADANYKLLNDLTARGNFTNQGSIDFTNRRTTAEGDFLNAEGAVLKSSGKAIFTGNRLQTIQLQAPLQPSAAMPPAVEFNGSVAPVLNSTAAPNFGEVTINNIDGAGIRTSVGWTVNLDFKVGPNAKFDGGPYTHNFYKTIDNSGTILSSGTINFSPKLSSLLAYTLNFGTMPASFQNTGTLYIGGAEKVTLAGTVPASLNNLEIANKQGLGLIMPDKAAWNLTGNLIIDADAKLAAGFNSTYTIGGNIIDNGTLDGAGSSFILTNAAGLANDPRTTATIDGIGNSDFGNLTVVSSAGLTLEKNINIYGDLTYNGDDLNTSRGEVNFTGPAASKIAAAGPVSLENIRVSKSTPAITVTLQADITDVHALQVESGTLDLGTKSMTKAPVLTDENEQGATLTVNNGAFLRVGGTNNIPQLDVYKLAEASTVEYYGSNQQVESTQYGHLNLLNLGTKTFKTGTAKIAGNFTKAPETMVVTPETMEYNGTASQQVAAINYKNLALTTGGTKTLATGTTGVSKAFTLTGGASINAATPGVTVEYNGTLLQDVLPTNYYNLKLDGSIKRFAGIAGIANVFTASGTTADLLTSENTINFNGGGAQNIPALDYKNLSVSGGNIKTLTGNAKVEKALLLTAGQINTGAHRITLNQATGTISETEAAYVTGTVETKREVAAGAEQTFGGLGLKITAPSGAGLTEVIRTTGTPVGLSDNSIRRQFAVKPTNNNGQLNATVTIAYFEHELNKLPESELVFYRSENGTSDWLMQATANTSVNAAKKEVTITGFNQFSSVTLGSKFSPLPIELIYFTATKSGSNAILKWATAMEADSKGVEVQVSADGVNFRAVGFVNSKGANTSQKQQYTFTEKEAGKKGTRYYRLRQIDNNGDEKFYGPQSIDFDAPTAITMQAYPNPFEDELMVMLGEARTGTATITLHDAVGKLLFTRKATVASADTILLNTQTVKQAGVYFLTLELNGEVYRVKLMRK